MKALFLLLLTLGFSLAQTGQMGPLVTRTYDLRELVTRPALVAVSPNYLTVLDFEDSVDEVASGRPELMNIEVRENLILIRSAKNAGATDLVVKVAGRVALFRVKIDPASFNPRRYLIRFPDPPATLGTGDGPGYATPRPGAARPETTRPTCASVQCALEARREQRQEPSWLPLNLKTFSTAEGHLYLTTVVENRGTNAVVFDGVRLKLYTLKGEEKIPVEFHAQTLGSGAYQGRVYGGESYSSLLLIKEPPQGELWLEWTVTEIGPGTNYTLRRKVDAPLVPAR